MNKKEMYSYFSLPAIIVDAAYDIFKNDTVEMIFEKKFALNKQKLNKEENELFYKIVIRFEKILKYITTRYSNGYQLEEIIESVKDNNVLPIKIMGANINRSKLQLRYNITFDNFNRTLEYLSDIEKYCFVHFYGINDSKYPIYEIADRLNITVNEVKHILVYVDSYFYLSTSKFKGKEKQRILYVVKNKQLDITEKDRLEIEKISIQQEKNIEESKQNFEARRKDSFFDYFDEADYQIVLKILKELDQEKRAGIKVLKKIYGPNYNKLKKYIKLNETQTSQVSITRRYIEDKIFEYKRTGDLNIYKTKHRRQSFFDYFDGNNIEKIREILKELENENNEKIPILKKLYGPEFDKLNHNVQLSTSEKRKIQKLKLTINRKLTKKVNANRKRSFYDYFDKDDQILVRKILDELKEQNNEKVAIIIKVYGIDYDKLNYSVKVTEEESKQIENLKRTIKKKLSGENNNISTTSKQKTSFFDYFDKEDRENVKIILDKLKQLGDKKIITMMKKYGDDYDTLVVGVKLSDYEHTQIYHLRESIRIKLEKQIPQSFYEYFEDQDAAKIILKGLKDKQSSQLTSAIKLYGENLESFNKDIILTEVERKQLANLKNYVKKRIGIKIGPGENNLENKQVDGSLATSKFSFERSARNELIIFKNILDTTINITSQQDIPDENQLNFVPSTDSAKRKSLSL